MDLLHSAQFGPHVEGFLAKFHAPGTSIAIVQNLTIASVAYGLVNLEPPKPMTADTLFDIASASKSLTAASIALLIDDDEKYPNVTYEATMSSLLPDDFVMAENSYTEGVTIDDVLSHRTGIAPHDESYLGPGSKHADNAKSVTRNLRNLAIAVPIRSKHLYCNMMYTVMTHLIETLTTLSFSEFLQKNFFFPLGMNATSLQPARARAKGLGERITPGYVWDDDNNKYIQFTLPDAPEAQGAGSIVTSVNDYVKYVRAIMNHAKPFSQDIYDGLIRSRSFEDPDYTQLTPFTSPLIYAAAWEVTFYRGYMIVAHGGSIAGAGTRHFFVPQAKFGGAIFTNSGNGGVIGDIIMSELIDDALKIPKQMRPDWEKFFGDKLSADGHDSGDEDPTDELRQELCSSNKTEPQTKPLSAYTGVYSNAGYHEMVVDIQEDKLHINGSDRSFAFQMEFEHACNQTKYIAHMYAQNEIGDSPIEAEFMFKGNTTNCMGLYLESEIDDLIWFERKE